ncbi:MAG: leucine-rich repeat domain-containing protein, partial [Bacilli bacterium]
MKRGITTLFILLMIAFSNKSIVGAEIKDVRLIQETNQIAPRGIGDSIAATFPDESLAKGVADELSVGDVNVILTQEMIDQITSLTLNGMEIEDLTGIELLVNLTYLELDNNNIKVVPDAIDQLKDLDFLYLNFNQLKSLPESIGNLKKLRFLLVEGNQIDSLPTSIGSMTSLTTLLLTDNFLSNVPSSISNLSNLELLYLDNNKFTEYPEAINSITSLEYLYLNRNEIAVIPPSIENLDKLFALFLSNNIIVQLPETIGGLNNLEYLQLSENRIESIPSSLGNLSNLTDLYLTSNQLVEIPSTIFSLPKIDSIYLEDNFLTALPENIGNATSMRYLYVSFNNLVSLPNSIVNNTNLIQLHVLSNQLTNLPIGFESLHKISTLLLADNLLPDNYNDQLKQLGFTTDAEKQRKLNDITSTLNEPIPINSEKEFVDVNLGSFAQLNDNSTAYDNHEYSLINIVDKNNKTVKISDYISNGEITKRGLVYAQISALSPGIFNSNINSVIQTQIVFDFRMPYYQLSFNLNGGEGKVPINQTLSKGDLVGEVAIPTRKGYVFKEWNTKADGSGIKWNFKTSL